MANTPIKPPARPMPAPRKPAPAPPRPTIAVTPDGKTFRSPAAQFDAVFARQREQMMVAATFLQGYGDVYGDGTRIASIGGLGAAGPLPTKDSLLLGPDGKFSNQRFEELKKILYDALGAADTQISKVEAAAKKAAASFGVESLSPTITAGKSVLRGIPDARKQLSMLRARVDKAATDANDALWSTIPPPTRTQTLFDMTLGQIQQQVSFAGGDLQLLDVALDQTVFAALGKRSLDMLKTAYKVGEKIVSDAADTVGKALEAAKSNIDAGIWLTKNWYWLALGAGALFFVVPPVLRTIRAARKGGIDAASQAAEESLVAGRQNISTAGRAAVTAGKAAINLTPQGRALTMAAAASKMQTAGLGRVTTRRRSQSKRHSR